MHTRGKGCTDTEQAVTDSRKNKSVARSRKSAAVIRLNKFLSSSGLCSRREADRLIEKGSVTVDGLPAHVGMSVSGKEDIRIGDQKVLPEQKKAVVAYYKPVGVTVTRDDPHAGVTLEEVFHYPIHLTYAGRLDRDSEGLLIMTNDGDLIEAMMRGANGHEKEYIVRTKSRISDAQLRQMAAGMYLTKLQVKTRPCRVERLGEYTFRIVLTQGLNRQIRRMCGQLGLEVKTLKRVRILNITVKGLRPGMQREITGHERQQLYKEAGLTSQNADSDRISQ